MEDFEGHPIFTPESLIEIFEDEDVCKHMAGEFINIYFQSTDKLILPLIFTALKERNWKDLTRHAHSLKGGTRNIGAQRLEQICAKLQKSSEKQEKAEKAGQPVDDADIKKFLSFALIVLKPTYFEVCKFSGVQPVPYAIDKEGLDLLGLKLEDVEVKEGEGAGGIAENPPSEGVVQVKEELNVDFDKPIEEEPDNQSLPKVPGSMEVVEVTKRSGSQVSFQQLDTKKDAMGVKDPNPSPMPKKPGTPPPEEHMDHVVETVPAYMHGELKTTPRGVSPAPHRTQTSDTKPIQMGQASSKRLVDDDDKSPKHQGSSALGGVQPVQNSFKEIDAVNFFELAENLRKAYKQRRGEEAAKVKYTCTIPAQVIESAGQFTSPLVFNNKKDGDDDDYPFDQGMKCMLI